MVFNKQLITNNNAIKEQEFYHPSRVFIFDSKKQQQLKEFLHTEPVKVTEEIAIQYSADGMLETLKQHIV